MSRRQPRILCAQPAVAWYLFPLSLNLSLSPEIRLHSMRRCPTCERVETPAAGSVIHTAGRAAAMLFARARAATKKGEEEEMGRGGGTPLAV